MKLSYKITVFLMIVCAVLMISACAQSPQSNVTGSSQTESSQTESLLADEYLFTIDDYDEYLSFLDSTDLPADFVTADLLEIFGPFAIFVDVSDWRDISGPYNYYNYCMIDEDGYRYSFDISRKEQLMPTDTDVLSQDDVNLSDMRSLPSKTRGAYTINGFTYRYAYGCLISIQWNRQGMYYALVLGNDLKDYPIDSSTPFARLVRIDNESILLMDYLQY